MYEKNREEYVKDLRTTHTHNASETTGARGGRFSSESVRSDLRYLSFGRPSDPARASWIVRRPAMRAF